MTKQKSRKYILGALLSTLVVALLITFSLIQSSIWQSKTQAANLAQFNENFDDYLNRTGEVKYLSDADVNPYYVRVGYGTFQKDSTDGNGTKITMRYDGQIMTFDHGLWAHATSNLHYNLEAIDPERKYTYFTAYVGLNTSNGGRGDGVIFNVYGSSDLNDGWTLLESRDQLPQNEGTFIKVDIHDYRYLRLEANAKGSNGNDHSVWADAKLTTADYNQYLIPDIAEYDEAIRDFGDASLADDTAYELAVLRRDFVSKVGQYTLSNFVEASAENRRALEWLYNDLQHMRWFILGGTPRGSYLNALNIISQIYTAHSADMSDARRVDLTNVSYGDVYSKLMISMALTHSSAFGAWYDSREISNPLRRYEIYKSMFERGLLDNKTFSRLEIEEMRFVTLAIIGDDEIEWLNNLARAHRGYNGTYDLDPYNYIRYTFGYNYGRAQYYTEENRTKWDEKYKLSQYGVPYGVSGKAKLWMVFEEGSVCGGLSKTGSNLWNAFGLPATVIGQPGHAAYLGMTMDEAGDGHWGLGNDVFGWARSEKSERFILGWGSPLMHKGYNVTYFGLGQDAINDIDNYTLAEETLMLKDLHADNPEELRNLYRQAIDIQPINLDAWYGLIQLYLSDSTTSETTYIELAKEIAETFKFYPLPMKDLMELIQSKITSAAGIAEYNAAQETSLKRAKVATTNDTKQAGMTVTMANYLLGQTNYDMAAFSFDGDNAGKIVLSAQYNDVLAMQYQYSLDGGQNWATKTIDENTIDHNVTLTNTELQQITAENDIKVRIVGANDLIHTIDITQAAAPTNLYANDQENRVMGVNLSMQWCEVTEDDACNSDSNNWISYRDSSPQRLGDISIRVRQSATGTRMTSEPTAEFHFTADAEPDRQYTYIPVSHLSMARVSSEALGANQNGNAAYALDGNYYTRWHSNWGGGDNERYLVVEFDRAVNLSRLEYVAGAGGNGIIRQADIYVSTNDELRQEDFSLVGKLSSNCNDIAENVTCLAPWSGAQNLDSAVNAPRIDSFNFKESVADVKYVAIKVTNATTAGGGNFATARMFNFYEDRRNVPDAPTANLSYSTIKYNNGNVLVRLVNPSTEIQNIQVVDGDGNVIAINDDNDFIRRVDETTLEFKENGEYKFTFTDIDGTPGEVLAKVNWIDRENPVGYIEYDRGINNPTNKSVTAKLIIQNGESVTVTNNAQPESGDEPDDGDSDPATSENPVWDPFTYTFENNGEFTFEFEDAAGNKGTATARVDWIDHAAPKVIVKYNTTEPTDDEVVATLEKVNFNAEETAARTVDEKHYDADGYEYDEDFTVTPSEGIVMNGDIAEYHFTKNGEFTFEYCDRAGNCANALAKVDWIREKQPETPDNPDHPTDPTTPDDPDEPDEPSDDNPTTPDDSNMPNNPDVNNPNNSGNWTGNNNSNNIPTNGDQNPDQTENSDSSDQEQDKDDGDNSNDPWQLPENNPPSNSDQKPEENNQTKSKWYQHPAVLWGVGGVALVVIVGIAAAMINNRRRW